jgi:hypothetical protein
MPEPDESIYLPALLAEEFGMSQSVAREQIVLGMVIIDGEMYLPESGNRLDVPRRLLVGHRLTVKGRDRQYAMTVED